MSSRAIDLALIEEWRELGFHYLLVDETKTWLLRGDRAGLRGFAESLRKYARDPRNHEISEHEHFGPYFYLKIITGRPITISPDGWTALPADFEHLASLIESKLDQSSFVIAEDFAPGTDFRIHFQVEPTGFDPSTADTEIEFRS